MPTSSLKTAKVAYECACEHDSNGDANILKYERPLRCYSDKLDQTWTDPT
ncbi:hypothetical protein BH10BDE1_BH10BDE1_13290 [soil metagenome]